MGLATLIQTTVGNRLPIVQGPSATLMGTLGPVAAQLGFGAVWGAALVGGIVEGLVGVTGLVGRARRWFPPAVTGAVVLIIGLSLGELAVRLAVGSGTALEIGLAGAVLVLVLTMRRTLGSVWGGLPARAAIFVSIWAIGLGAGGVFGVVDWELVAASAWFAPPALFPFGGPGFGWSFPVAAILAALAGYAGSMVESIGDYAATCEAARVEYGVGHMNRGIAAEGFACALSATLGALPSTSYTQNIGIISATGVASRTVVRIAGLIFVAYGLCPKFGALLVAIPRSVLGGVFLLVCWMIAVSGARLVRRAPRTGANRVVVAASLGFGLGVPALLRFGPGRAVAEWLPDPVALVLTNPIVLGVVLAVSLNALIGGGEPVRRHSA